MTLHAQAAAVVCRNATSVTDARLLLEHLGIVAPGGHVLLPDPPPEPRLVTHNAGATARDPWSSPRAQAEMHRRPEGCTTPPGLRDLPPVTTPAKKAPRVKSTRPAPSPTETERLIAVGVNRETAEILGAAS